MGNGAGPGFVTTSLSWDLPTPFYLPLTTARCLGESRAGHSAYHSCLSWEDFYLGKAPRPISQHRWLSTLLVLAAEGSWGQFREQTALEPLEASVLSQLLLSSVSLNGLPLEAGLAGKGKVPGQPSLPACPEKPLPHGKIRPGPGPSLPPGSCSCRWGCAL